LRAVIVDADSPVGVLDVAHLMHAGPATGPVVDVAAWIATSDVARMVVEANGVKIIFLRHASGETEEHDALCIAQHHAAQPAEGRGKRRWIRAHRCWPRGTRLRPT